VASVPEGLQELKYRFLESLKSSGTDTLSEAVEIFHISWMQSGLPVEPTLNIYRLIKSFFI
jgi:hypothetical protein